MINYLIGLTGAPVLFTMLKLGLPVELIAFWSGICLWGCLNFARDLIKAKKEKESMCKFWDLVTGENNIWQNGGENQDDKI